MVWIKQEYCDSDSKLNIGQWLLLLPDLKRTARVLEVF